MMMLAMIVLPLPAITLDMLFTFNIALAWTDLSPRRMQGRRLSTRKHPEPIGRRSQKRLPQAAALTGSGKTSKCW